MHLITDQYLNLNNKLHLDVPEYGISGQKYVSQVINICKEYRTQDVLDYGCGKSTLAMNLPFPIKQYDPAIPKYSNLPNPADFVVCTDVLEHIEPYCLEDVLDHLKQLTVKVIFLVVATRPAQKTLADGRNAHLIQKPAKWWLTHLMDRFELKDFSADNKGFIAKLTKNIGNF